MMTRLRRNRAKPLDKFFDFNNPFYRPIWLRIAIVAVSIGWGIFELLAFSPFWGVIFIGMGAVAFYGLFIAFDPPETGEDSGQKK